MENLEKERSAVESAVKIARLMGDQMEQHERENKRFDSPASSWPHAEQGCGRLGQRAKYNTAMGKSRP